MKKRYAILSVLECVLCMNLESNVQVFLNFKVKLGVNEKGRTMMLDILRAKMYQGFKQEFIYKVNHFKMGGGYANFTGEALRKDGKEITYSEDEAHVCCFKGVLFRKNRINGTWKSRVFSPQTCVIRA